MKKRVLSIISIAVLLIGPFTVQNANSQVFLTQEDMERVDRDNPDLPGIPHLAITTDQYQDQETYSPIGGGLLVLSCLGGAYLLGKKKSNK